MIHSSDYSALVKACQANPYDNIIRLALADWCEENGYQQYAELLRTMNVFAFQAAMQSIAKACESVAESLRPAMRAIQAVGVGTQPEAMR